MHLFTVVDYKLKNCLRYAIRAVSSAGAGDYVITGDQVLAAFSSVDASGFGHPERRPAQ